MIGNFPNYNFALERTSQVKWRVKSAMEMIQSNTITLRKTLLAELSRMVMWMWMTFYFVSFFVYGRPEFHPAVEY